MLTLDIYHCLEKFTLDLSFEIEQELVALFGASGAGKSLTLQAIAGLFRPEQGRISLNGQVVFDHKQKIDLPPQRRHVGYVMQDYTLFPHLTVGQNIGYGLRRRPKLEIKRVVGDMLDLIQLTGFGNRSPAELSGGQKQRVALARALATNPSILLLDEPFSALDGPTRAQLRLDLKAWQTQLKVPTLLVTHDLAEANILADRVAIYQQGKLLQMGQPTEVMRRPAHVGVAYLTGNTNCFSGEVVAVDNEKLQVAVGSLMLDTPLYPYTVGQTVTCCIRPEQVLMLRPKNQNPERANVARGKIVSIMTDGLGFSLQLLLEGARLHPRQPFDLTVILPLHVFETLNPQVDQAWSISLKREAIHLIQAS